MELTNFHELWAQFYAMHPEFLDESNAHNETSKNVIYERKVWSMKALQFATLQSHLEVEELEEETSPKSPTGIM